MCSRRKRSQRLLFRSARHSRRERDAGPRAITEIRRLMPLPRPTGNADWVVRASAHPFVQCLRLIRARSMRRAVPSRSFGDHPRVVCACGSESTLGWAASLSWAIDGATRALARTRRTNARAAVDSLRASPLEQPWTRCARRPHRGASAVPQPRGRRAAAHHHLAPDVDAENQGIMAPCKKTIHR